MRRSGKARDDAAPVMECAMRTCHTSPPDEARFPPHWRGAGAHCTGRYAGEKNFVDFEGDHNSRRPKFFHVRRAAGRACAAHACQH